MKKNYTIELEKRRIENVYPIIPLFNTFNLFVLKSICFFSLLFVLVGQSAKAQDNSIGAGSYEVYTGSAFHIRQLMDSSIWSYVANKGDGIFWHPVGYHNDLGNDNVSPAEWIKLATFFKGKKAIAEGDMLNGDILGDVSAINRLKSLGFDPNMVFVNRIQDTMIHNWPLRIAKNLSYGVNSGTMLAPHVMEKYPKGFYDPLNAQNRIFIDSSYGSSVDAPTYLFVNHAEAYRQSVYDVIDYCHKKGKKFTYLISPNASADSFLIDSKAVVHALEDHDRIPDYFGVEIYGLSWNIDLTPESIKNTSGDIVCANTVTGVSRWLLKHARADEQELDLFVKAPNGTNYAQNIVAESVNEISPIATNNWVGTNGTFKFSVFLKNRSKYIDFIPTLKANISGLPTGWSITYMFNGTDITNAIKGTGYLFYKTDRLMPLDEKEITVTISKTGETKLPSTLDLRFEVRPQPNSIFVRDVIQLKSSPTYWDFTTSTEDWNTPTNMTMNIVNGINWMTITAADPHVSSPDNLLLSASQYKYVVIRLQNQTVGSTAELFWSTTTNASFNSTNRVSFPIVPNDNSKQRYYIIDLSTNANWTGTIKQLRLDPTTAASGTVKVDFIKITGAYPTIPASIPGIIQAENFNYGGQGNAYNDSTQTTNSGNQYRTSEGVDISVHPQQTGNYIVGWVASGEWLDYLVNIQKESFYNITASVSSPQSTATFDVLLDGDSIAPEIKVPNTGAFNIYQDITVTTNIKLPIGLHVLRIKANTAGFNIDKLQCTDAIITQTIALKIGWNLISTNVYPQDSSIATLFVGLDVQEIKTENTFWRKGQNIAFNSLKTITSGQGYLVKMNVAGTLKIAGLPVETQNFASLQTGWNLIGCPFQNVTTISTFFNVSNCKTVKNFDGFWIPNGTLNSLSKLEPGKAYFIKK